MHMYVWISLSRFSLINTTGGSFCIPLLNAFYAHALGPQTMCPMGTCRLNAKPKLTPK